MRQVRTAAGQAIAGPIVVADVGDDERRQLASLLREAGYPVMEATTAADVIEAIRDYDAALVILEVALSDTSGYEVCRLIREMIGEYVPVLFLSGLRTESYDRVGGLLLGADDYLVKPCASDELLARVRALVRRTQKASVARRANLTARELEVLSLLTEGLATDAMAERMFISPKTVGTHIENVLGKLGAHNRAHAVAIAYGCGLIAGSVPAPGDGTPRRQRTRRTAVTVSADASPGEV